MGEEKRARFYWVPRMKKKTVHIGNHLHRERGVVLGGSSVDYLDGKRRPQLGSLIIGNHVWIGANATIARGRNEEENTIIGDDVSIGPNATVGHGCVVEEGVLILGGAMVAGHVHIGKGAVIGCGAVVRNRIKIGEGATVGLGAVVTKDVMEGMTVVGNPAKEQRRKNS